MLKISCLCPTYNRAPHKLVLVEEAVEAFLRQDYPHKELVVLNDTPGQTLRFDHPQVQIINTSVRCASLGEKRNLLAQRSSGELLCVWDDDDISLPWRLSRSVELLGDADYYNPSAYWFLDHQGLHYDHVPGCSYFACLYRRGTFEELGGHPSISLGEDQAMDAKLRTRHVAQRPPLPIEEWFYIYRWGVSPSHVSSRGEGYYEELGQQPIVAGEFTLAPHWEHDYTAVTRAVAFARTVSE
jgi:glycosyltransferase involved in cell wall biosynthesis